MIIPASGLFGVTAEHCDCGPLSLSAARGDRTAVKASRTPAMAPAAGLFGEPLKHVQTEEDQRRSH